MHVCIRSSRIDASACRSHYQGERKLSDANAAKASFWEFTHRPIVRVTAGEFDVDNALKINHGNSAKPLYFGNPGICSSHYGVEFDVNNALEINQG